MPTYQPPQSDADRLSVLAKIPNTDAVDRAANHPYLEPELVAEVVAFLVKFQPAYDAIAGALSKRVKEVAEREAARAILDTHVRDFWEVLKRRAHRQHESVSVLAFYGLPTDGIVPAIDTFDALVGFADGIVKGDASAVAAGFAAMANPSVGEVAGVLAVARTQAKDVPVADRNYDDAQAAIAALRPQADLLIDDGIAGLRYALRRFDAPGARRIQRSYGYAFAYLPDEPIDPEPTAGPTPVS